MAGWTVVLMKIAAMFAVMLTGFLARHRKYFSHESTVSLSRFTVDLALPALIFNQMLTRVPPETLRAGWPIPLLGCATMVLGYLVGLAMLPLAPRSERPTFLILVTFSNWVFLPLPIVQELFHDEGQQVVFLYNVGGTLTIWSLGVWTLHSHRLDLASLRRLALNPGLLATVIGVSAALLFPELRRLSNPAETAHGAWSVALQALLQGVSMLGDLTIGLSLLVTGAQLGELEFAEHRPSLALVGSVAGRLLIAPAFTVLVFWLAGRAGWALPDVTRHTIYLIAAMPVAVTCGVLTERYEGDPSLAARGIMYSTLCGMATVPAFYYLIELWKL